MKNNDPAKNTQSSDYTEYLLRKQRVGWKQLLDVQAPYRWNLLRLKPGFTLDIGCGIGRNLLHLKGQGVGVDHNLQSVEIARKQGLLAFTPEELWNSDFDLPQRFDSLLLAHVAEHMTLQAVVELLEEYMHLLRSGGKLIIITPQEAGYQSDSTHVEFMDFPKLSNINRQLGLSILQEYSFPFPRFVGTFFIYNEFISVARKNDRQ
jgi:SAM-dependent methyltransferase